MTSRSDNFEPFFFLEGGGFHCRSKGLQSRPNLQPLNFAPAETPETALEDGGELVVQIRAANSTLKTDFRVPDYESNSELSSPYSPNPEAARFVATNFQLLSLYAETPECTPRAALDYSQGSCQFPTTFVEPTLLQIEVEECSSTSGNWSQDPAASSFSSQPSTKSLLNPEVHDFTPLRSKRPLLRPEALGFVPVANTKSDSPQLPLNSPLNPEVIEFSPAKAALASLGPKSLEIVLPGSKKPSLELAATVSVLPTTSSKYQSKPSREELLHTCPGNLILKGTPWPISIGVSGVRQDWFEHRFQELASYGYIDIESEGLGVDFGVFPAAKDEDFDIATELDAALTKPPPVSMSIPDLLMASSGLVEMPRLPRNISLPIPESIQAVDKSEAENHGVPLPQVLSFPPKQIILNTGDVVILPEVFPRYDPSQFRKNIRTQLKSPLSQCVVVDRSVEMDESLRRLRELPSIANWADEVDCEGDHSPCTNEPYIKKTTTMGNEFPAASQSILLDAPHHRPSDLTEGCDLRKTCLVSSAVQCLTVPAAKQVFNQGVDDSLERLRAMDTLEDWTDNVECEDTNAPTSDTPVEKYSKGIYQDTKPVELEGIGKEAWKASDDEDYSLDGFAEFFELATTSYETYGSESKSEGKVGPSESPLHIHTSPNAIYEGEKVEWNGLFGVMDPGPSPTDSTKDFERKNYVLGADSLSPESTLLPENHFVEAAELACESEGYVLRPPFHPAADIIEPEQRSLGVPALPSQDDLTAMLKNVTAIDDTTQSVVSACIVQPLAIRKKSASILLGSPALTSTSDPGNNFVAQSDGSYSEIDDESLFDNGIKENHARRFDIDTNPEARSTTPTPSPSSSEDGRESTEKEKPLSSNFPKQRDDSDAKQSPIIKLSHPVSFSTFDSPFLIESDSNLVDSKSPPTIELAPFTLAFRPAPATKFGKPSQPQTAFPVQAPSKPGDQIMMPGHSQSKLLRSPEVQDFHTLGQSLGLPDSNAHKELFSVSSYVSITIKSIEEQPSFTSNRQSPYSKTFDPFGEKPLSQMELIGEYREPVGEEEVLTSPESPMAELKDLGHRQSGKMAEVSKANSDLSRLVDGVRWSTQRSNIPIPSPTRTPVKSPLQSRSSFGGSNDDVFTLSSEAGLSSSPIKRSESNTPTKMRQGHSCQQLQVIGESIGVDSGDDERGLGTILEESQIIDSGALAASSQTLAPSLAIAKQQRPAISPATVSINNQEEEGAGKLLSDMEGKLPLPFIRKVQIDSITPGMWLSGNLINGRSLHQPAIINHSPSLWPSPLKIPPRTSSLNAPRRMTRLQPNPSTPTHTTTKTQGFRATTPTADLSSSILRQIIANYPTNITPLPSSSFSPPSQHPSFEFFSGVQSAATEQFDELPSTPTGFITGLRGTASVRKAFDQAYAAEGRRRSSESIARYRTVNFETVIAGTDWARTGITSTKPASDRKLPPPAASIAASFVEVKGDINTPRRAGDVPFIPLRRGGAGQKQRSRISRWIYGGVERKLEKKKKKKKKKKKHKESGREVCENGKSVDHTAPTAASGAPAPPIAGESDDPDMERNAARKPHETKDSFFRKMKKIMILRLGTRH